MTGEREIVLMLCYINYHNHWPATCVWKQIFFYLKFIFFFLLLHYLLFSIFIMNSHIVLIWSCCSYYVQVVGKFSLPSPHEEPEWMVGIHHLWDRKCPFILDRNLNCPLLLRVLDKIKKGYTIIWTTVTMRLSSRMSATVLPASLKYQFP